MPDLQKVSFGDREVGPRLISSTKLVLLLDIQASFMLQLSIANDTNPTNEMICHFLPLLPQHKLQIIIPVVYST